MTELHPWALLSELEIFPPTPHWSLCHLCFRSILRSDGNSWDASLQQDPNRQSSSKWVGQIDSTWMSSRTQTWTSPVCWYPPSCGISPHVALALLNNIPKIETGSFDQIQKHEITLASAEDSDHAGSSILTLGGQIKGMLTNMGTYWTQVLDDVTKINCIHHVISSGTVLSCGLNDIFYYILRKYTL